MARRTWGTLAMASILLIRSADLLYQSRWSSALSYSLSSIQLLLGVLIRSAARCMAFFRATSVGEKLTRRKRNWIQATLGDAASKERTNSPIRRCGCGKRGIDITLALINETLKKLTLSVPSAFSLKMSSFLHPLGSWAGSEEKTALHFLPFFEVPYPSSQTRIGQEVPIRLVGQRSKSAVEDEEERQGRTCLKRAEVVPNKRHRNHQPERADGGGSKNCEEGSGFPSIFGWPLVVRRNEAETHTN